MSAIAERQENVVACIVRIGNFFIFRIKAVE